MKPTKLLIQNIGIVADETILIDKPLIIFYGEIRQGKTTILNAVRWVCGGEFPTDILRHGSKDGFIELQFSGGHIRREFYLAKDGKTVKARAVEFVRDGRPVGKPVQEIEKLLNPFTLDQDYLIRMKEADRNRYFLDLFGVNTTDIDTALYTLEKEASDLRSQLKGYGSIDLTEHKQVDAAQLRLARKKIVDDATTARQELEGQLDSINKAYDSKCETYRSERSEIDGFNLRRQTRSSQLESVDRDMIELQKRLEALKSEAAEIQNWLAENPKKDDIPAPFPPDTSALKQQILALHSPDTSAVDSRLSDAAAANVRADQYEKNLARENERKVKAEALDSKEKAVKAKREEKVTRLKTINDSCKIPDLTFTDAGEFSFEDTTAAMLSTSQLMKLSSALSDLYPPGLGIELLDRGESLGKSIFELIDRAKNDEKTILATVVGERPATAPEQVGVFVVAQGKVSQ